MSPPADPSVRLQKLLSQAGLASRREAEEWIRQGRVSVNGRVAELGERADPSRDAIKVDGRRLRAAPSEKTYLLLNKPKGFVTTTDDPEQRDTVMDLIPGNLRGGVRPVGRLDVQTEGLLLLTDDGDLARDVTHPSKGCAKEYEVKVSGVPGEKDLAKLRVGIYVDGRRTRPCDIVRMRTTAGRGEGNAWFRVTLREGRTRQIRRMFETIGHPVSKLKRVAIGPIRDSVLPVGATRRLARTEVEALKRSLAGGAEKPAALAAPRAPATRARAPRRGSTPTPRPSRANIGRKGSRPPR
jgi:23S rRNA pseudouridine2605 synthase